MENNENKGAHGAPVCACGSMCGCHHRMPWIWIVKIIVIALALCFAFKMGEIKGLLEASRGYMPIRGGYSGGMMQYGPTWNVGTKIPAGASGTTGTDTQSSTAPVQ